MLRRPESPSLDAHLIKKPKTTTTSCCPRRLTWVAAALLSLQLLFLRSARRATTTTTTITATQTCDSGLVYVYDLPPKFNKDIIADCDNLTPWHSLCDALSNSGFGPKSTDLAGFIPDHLLSSWYATDQFTAELLYHRRVLSHPCRTTNPSAASAFYIPFYPGLVVGKHLWSPNSTSEDRDGEAAALLSWIRKQNSWRKTGGQDHFLVLGRITWDFRRHAGGGDWGSSFLYMPEMRQVTRLLPERSPWDRRDVGIPYPTGFHPKTAVEVREWQRFLLSKHRRKLFSFAGATRARFADDFRTLLVEECEKAGPECRKVECESRGRCGKGNGSAVGVFLDSVFCLQPRGDSYTRRSVFDCLVAGAIPVLFWRRSVYEQYEWYLPVGPGEEKEWSVFLDRRKVRRRTVSLKEVLEGIGEEKVRRMREKVVGLIPRLVYAGKEEGFGEGMEDAVDVAVIGVLRRFEERRRQERKEANVAGVFSWLKRE